jgi:uncharacterized protein YeaO (DUF488 family)
MPLHTKRWNDPVDPTDGTRILITRFRPRGLPKAEETWTEWMTNLAPSKELLGRYNNKIGTGISWNDYRAGYLREMRAQHEAIVALAERVRQGETITLLCSSQCVRESRCHRSLLRELIEKALAG